VGHSQRASLGGSRLVVLSFPPATPWALRSQEDHAHAGTSGVDAIVDLRPSLDRGLICLSADTPLVRPPPPPPVL